MPVRVGINLKLDSYISEFLQFIMAGAIVVVRIFLAFRIMPVGLNDPCVMDYLIGLGYSMVLGVFQLYYQYRF